MTSPNPARAGAAPTRWAESHGVRLAVWEEGAPDGPVVLLVHGYPDTHRVWDDVAAALVAAGFRVVRYDTRGAGVSGVPAEGLRGYRLDRLADDLLAVADAVSPGRPVHVAAHDWGSIQAWEAVTGPRAAERLASFTTLSGPCLDHVGHGARRRLARPTPRHLAQTAAQLAHSWYIGFFHLPVLPSAVWRAGLAARWGSLLARAEGVTPRPGHPQPTLRADAVRGIALYRANMLPRLLRPRSRPTPIPVQLIALRRDHYVRPFLHADLERWAPRLTRRELDETHWSALLERGPRVAGLIADFAGAVTESVTEAAAGAGESATGSTRGAAG
jgi:pimeloyl-ACP methyl ester carboxylesterase